jgi:hypothetical protein
MSGATKFQWPTGPLRSKFFAEQGQPEVLKWDVLDLAPNTDIAITFVQARDRRQGIWMRSEGGLIVDGSRYQQIELWTDTAPPQVQLTVAAKDGRLHLYNVWDPGTGSRSQGYRSGMIKEAIPGGYRYHCNDTGMDVDFERLVFELRIVSS